VKKPKAKKNYINNKDFYLALVAYQDKVKICEEEGRGIPEMSMYIGQCIMKIAENLGSKYNFGKITIRG